MPRMYPTRKLTVWKRPGPKRGTRAFTNREAARQRKIFSANVREYVDANRQIGKSYRRVSPFVVNTGGVAKAKQLALRIARNRAAAKIRRAASRARNARNNYVSYSRRR